MNEDATRHQESLHSGEALMCTYAPAARKPSTESEFIIQVDIGTSICMIWNPLLEKKKKVRVYCGIFKLQGNHECKHKVSLKPGVGWIPQRVNSFPTCILSRMAVSLRGHGWHL